MTDKPARPFGVLLIVILIVLNGLSLLVTGIMGLVRGGNGGAGIAVSIVLLAAALIYLLVAKGLYNGNRFSRFLVAVFSFLALVGSIWSAAIDPSTRVVSIIQAIIAAVILALLYSSRASRFFD